MSDVTVGVDSSPATPPRFSIEVEESVFKRLHTLATKEGISINELGSALIKRLLLLHRTEVRRVIDEIKWNRE
jgi:hypothetical protein